MILDSKQWQIKESIPTNLFLDYWYVLVIVNFISLILAIKFSHQVTKIIPKNFKILGTSIFFILLITVYLVGESTRLNGTFDAVIFVLATLLCYKLPKVNFLPFVFWIIIGDIWLQNFYRLWQLL